MDAVTYSIKNGNKNSETYYDTIRHFTDEILDESKDTLMPLVYEYKEYLKTYGLETLREDEEYILELISFGVLWNVYAETALRVKNAPFITLAKMSEWRKKHQKLKPYIDLSRGFLFTLFLLKEKTNKVLPTPTLNEIDHVCKWFEATGEFREQALRFVRWRAYWGTKSTEQLQKIFLTIREFTKFFYTASLQTIGTYTENVEYFLESKKKKYRWREDRISCMRTRLEYHLNMLGAELMNRALRKEFKTTETKVVLLPGCMRTHQNSDCKAIKFPEGLLCNGCTSSCNVNKIREMGKRKNFAVYVIPHASDLSLWGPKEGTPSRGIIASACVTTLVEGGWELKRYDVPAQCVLLESSGCKKHWHCTSICTEINIRELKRILN